MKLKVIVVFGICASMVNPFAFALTGGSISNELLSAENFGSPLPRWIHHRLIPIA